MTLNLDLVPQNEDLKPSISVVGVGGAGGNAVNNMIKSSLEGANFVVANTDAQALKYSLAEKRVQLGISVTQGLGAGASPEVGRAAAEESIEEIERHIRGSNMVFITAGMGGGTGTGAAPVVARLAREMGILTVGVVTKPFHFEGSHRMRLAEQGLEDLQKYVDTLIVIPNQNLFRIANEKTTFADAFAMADDVLHSGVRGITDLMVMPGLINLDFADIRAVMSEMGKAMMGTGEAEGDRRAVEAAEAAISNPLLDDVSMKGAKGVLINVTGGSDLTLFEVDEAANRIRDEVDPEANIIFGAIFDEKMQGTMRVSVVATGVEIDQAGKTRPNILGQRPLQAQAIHVPKRPSAFSSGAPSAAAQPQPLKPAASAKPKEEIKISVSELAIRHKEIVKDDDAQPSLLDTAVEATPVPDFIPPRPVEPASRQVELTLPVSPSKVRESDIKSSKMREPDTKSSKSRQSEAKHQAVQIEEAEESSREGGFGLGLFQKVGKVFHRAAEEQPESAAVVKEIKQPRVVETSPRIAENAVGQDEYLDIPAFLRRQAN